MVAIKSLLISSALATSAFGRVLSLSAPDTVQAGHNITATLHVRGYIQNWDDFGVIWGLKNATGISGPKDVGERLSYNNLFPDALTPNQTFSVPVPKNQQPGEYTFTAAVPYLVAAAGYTDIRYFTHNLTVTA